MPPPDDVALGPLMRTVLDGAIWRDDSQFPAHQSWADEVERVLSFLEARGVFGHYLRRLRANHWQGALAEARAGFFFHRNGFQILEWEPEVVQRRPGDLEIQWDQTEPIFVEVKGPGWEGELSAQEIRAGRRDQPKYINAEGRAVDPAARVVYAVEKSLPKLSNARCNLVVVVDDLFLSPTEVPKEFLTPQILRGIADARFATASAILILNPVSYGGPVEYRKYYIPNPNAGRPLPESVHEGFVLGNSDPQGPRWARD